MSEKKQPKSPTFPLKERLSDNEYMKLKRFAQEFMGLEKNYAKHAKRKPK